LNLLSRIKNEYLRLRERERKELKLWISECVHDFLSGQPLKGGGGLGGSLFIAPTSKEPLEESFTGQVRWTSLEAGKKFLETGPIPDKSDSPD
jgi:hypothetical protein